MTRFKFNARLFGGIGLFLFFLVIIFPVWAGLLETGVIGEPARNLVQSEIPREPIFISTATIPLLVGMVISFFALVVLYRYNKKRRRS